MRVRELQKEGMSRSAMVLKDIYVEVLELWADGDTWNSRCLTRLSLRASVS